MSMLRFVLVAVAGSCAVACTAEESTGEAQTIEGAGGEPGDDKADDGHDGGHGGGLGGSTGGAGGTPSTGEDAEVPEVDLAPPPPPPTEPPVGVPALGAGSHSADRVKIEVLATRSNGLRTPRDLGFDPEVPGRLWVVNRTDDSVVIFHDVNDPDGRIEKRIDPFALHFMEEVSSIEFGAPGFFGTCQESRNTYDNQADPNDFMGPSLWSSDLEIFGYSNPEAVAFLGYDLGSHLDMLHESPFCMGIAWESENVYWTFDGLTGSLTRADFMQDHGIGYDDHSDGRMQRYVEGEVTRVPDVPSHMVFDRRDGKLYVADTGNARVAVLDSESGSSRGRMPVIEPGTQLWRMVDASLTTLADADGAELVLPSGLALHGDLLYVTDHETSRITAMSLTGEIVDWLDTGLEAGSLMGIEIDEAGRLYVVDAARDRVLRISAQD